MKRFIGVDLHKNMFTVCYLDQNGKDRIQEYKITDIERFARSLQKEDEVAVEATGNSRNFCERIVERVGKVVQVDPGQFKVICLSHKKTDKRDASMLALHLSLDRLPVSRIMNKERARIKSLAATRDNWLSCEQP